MKVALLLGVLLVDMLIGFYGMGGIDVTAPAGQVGGGTMRAMDGTFPPPPPPPSFP